jgi:hypothetical protein
MAAGIAAGHPVDDSTADPATSRITGRMSADQFRSILAQAQTEQTDLSLSSDLKRDANALAAVLQTFQKNYSGLGGFIRNVQIRQPAVSHLIGEIKKRLGKEMIPKEPSDVVEMATAADRCLDYLNSPDLESGVTADVAQVIRQTATSNLEKMDEQAERISGLGVRSLVARANQRVADAVRARENRAQIPTVTENIRFIESALDQGNIRGALQGWTTLTSSEILFQFEKAYIDGSRPLLADVTLLDSCKSALQNVQDLQPKVADARKLLLVHSCRSSASNKPNTTAFLDDAERSLAQAVEQKFGSLPSDDDLKRFLQSGHQLQASASPAVGPAGLTTDPSAATSQDAEEETTEQEQASPDATEGETQSAADNTQGQQQSGTSASTSASDVPQGQSPAPSDSDSLPWLIWGLLALAIVGIGGWLLRRKDSGRDKPARYEVAAEAEDPEVAELLKLEEEREPGGWEKLGQKFAAFAGNNDTRWTGYLSDETNEHEASNCLVLDLALIAGTFCYEDFDEAMMSLSFSSITGELPGFEHRMAFLKEGQYSGISGEVWTPHSVRAAVRCDAATGSKIAPVLVNLFKQWVSAVVSKVSSSTQEKCAGQVTAYNKTLDSLLQASADSSREPSDSAEPQTLTKFEEDCQLLGIETEFTLDELSAARRRKAAQWHPDKLTGMAPELSEYAGRELSRINGACDRLEKVVKEVGAEPLQQATECVSQMILKHNEELVGALTVLQARGEDALGYVEQVIDHGDEVVRRAYALRARFRREAPGVDLSVMEKTVSSLINSNRSLRTTAAQRRKAMAARA